MLFSMTGFGKAQGIIDKKKINVEIRSLNSKQADINTRLPHRYKERDLDIRSIIGNELKRGKMECFINYENLSEESSSTINIGVVNGYLNQLKALGKDVDGDLLSIAMRLPEVMVTRKEDLQKEEAEGVIQLVKEAVSELKNYREQEGAVLEKELVSYVQNIENLLEQVKEFEEGRITNIKERITKHLEELVEKENILNDRLEQELIFYVEKLDITEEKVRLKANCQYYIEIIQEEGKDLKGKKLGFISQEIGREINTLGSKANDSSIQKIVVQMKDELEKIKEQTLNVL